jgi:hypothetical protein
VVFYIALCHWSHYRSTQSYLFENLKKTRDVFCVGYFGLSLYASTYLEVKILCGLTFQFENVRVPVAFPER